MPTRKAIEIGERFGCLLVVGDQGKDGHGKYRVECLCDCGNRTLPHEAQLRSGKTQSCGHLKVNYQRFSHRMCHTPEYVAYSAARQRCVNPKSPEFKNYGARGIEFRFRSFEEFFAEIGSKSSPDLSLDRIDNDGHYEPGNVRWATPAQQSANRRVCKKTPT